MAPKGASLASKQNSFLKRAGCRASCTALCCHVLRAGPHLGLGAGCVHALRKHRHLGIRHRADAALYAALEHHALDHMRVVHAAACKGKQPGRGAGLAGWQARRQRMLRQRRRPAGGLASPTHWRACTGVLIAAAAQQRRCACAEHANLSPSPLIFTTRTLSTLKLLGFLGTTSMHASATTGMQQETEQLSMQGTPKLVWVAGQRAARLVCWAGKCDR